MEFPPKQVYTKTITLFGVIPIFKKIIEQDMTESLEKEPTSEDKSLKQIGFITSAVHVNDEPYDDI